MEPYLENSCLLKIYHQAQAGTCKNDPYKDVSGSKYANDDTVLGNSFFYKIFISQIVLLIVSVNSVDTIGKLESIRKVML